MEEVIEFDTARFCKKYVQSYESFNRERNACITEFSLQFVRGATIRVSTETEYQEPSGIYRSWVYGGYNDLRSAFIGWVGSQGWKSVLEPKYARMYHDTPTTITRVVTEHHTNNVIPLVRDRYKDRVLYSFSRDDDNAVNYEMRLDWLTRKPLTRQERYQFQDQYYFDHRNT
jgi:hypothetical protein